MTLFVDASALVAIIADEPGSNILSQRINDDDDPLWSAMTEWEAVTALCRSYNYPVEVARREVNDFATARPFRRVAIDKDESVVALDAYQTYGKGRHPAGLNLGDCFAYACAKTNGAELLYKGDDFARTDLA